MQVAKQHTERYANRYGGVASNTRAASRSARVRGADPARLNRKASARSDRETWAGSGITISGSPGGGLKHFSKAARSKADQDDSARWGTAGRRQPREPTSETPTRTKYCKSNTADAKGTAPGIYIFCLKPAPPCMPYSYDKKGSPRERAREIVRPTGARTAAAYVRGSTESGENNPIYGGGSSSGRSGGGGGGSDGGPATLFGSFALEVRPRQSEEGGTRGVSSRERAARDVQSFFRRTSRSRGYKCGRWAGETWREEKRRSIVHSQISGEGVGCRRCHYDGTCPGDVATPACSQTVKHVISHCSADNIALSQSSVDTPPLSKLRVRVIAAWWTGGVVNAAITRITSPSAVHHGEERRFLPSPENALGSARVVARDVMANVTEVCLLYAALAHDLRLTTSAAELETTPLPSSSSSAVMTSAEANYVCARKIGTGNHSSWAEHRNVGEETQLNRVSDASANSPPTHGVAHIFFPTPPCSTALALPDQADSSCTGISSLLAQQGGASSSALFARLDGGEMEEIDDRSTLTAISVVNGGSPTSAAEDRSVADISNRVMFDGSTRWDNAGGYLGKPDTSEAFTPINAPIANKTRDICEDRCSVHCSDTIHAPMANKTMATPEYNTSVHSSGTADQVDTRRSEKCVPEGGSPAQTAALQVSFAGLGTRPAVAVRSSVTSGLTRKGGGFLFKKRWCSPRPEYGGDGDGGGGSADGSGGGESMTSFISFSTIGPDGPGETSSPSSSLTGLPRGEPAKASDVAATGLGSGAIVGRRRVLPLRTRSRSRHAHHIIGDRSLKGAGAGDNRDTGGMAHTIFGVAIDTLSKAASGGAVIPSGKAGEKPPAVDRRCRVLVSGQRVPRSDPGRSRRAFPVMGEGAGVDAEIYRGGGDSAAAESSSRGREGSVSIKTAVNADDVCVKLAQRVPRKPSRGGKPQSSSTASPRKILYRGVVTS